MQGCEISCGTVVFFQKSRNLSRSLLTNNNFYCARSVSGKQETFLKSQQAIAITAFLRIPSSLYKTLFFICPIKTMACFLVPLFFLTFPRLHPLNLFSSDLAIFDHDARQKMLILAQPHARLRDFNKRQGMSYRRSRSFFPYGQKIAGRSRSQKRDLLSDL